MKKKPQSEVSYSEESFSERSFSDEPYYSTSPTALNNPVYQNMTSLGSHRGTSDSVTEEPYYSTLPTALNKPIYYNMTSRSIDEHLYDLPLASQRGAPDSVTDSQSVSCL